MNLDGPPLGAVQVQLIDGTILLDHQPGVYVDLDQYTPNGVILWYVREEDHESYMAVFIPYAQIKSISMKLE